MIAVSVGTALLAGVDQVVVDLARARHHALDLAGRSMFFVDSPMTGWKLTARQVGQRRTGVLVAQQRLGRQDHQRLAERTDHLAAQQVEDLRRPWSGCTTWHVVVGAQLQETLDAGRASVPDPGLRSRAAASSSGRDWRPHLTSPTEMNWSITTWAPLTKSPNWASQMISVFGSALRVAVFEAQHRLFGQHRVDHR